ncbi:MAG: hypothetical protein J6V15_07040 [Clostridia bacterium]|nr:hypothetical protein [Clostridia bacterium]
MQYSDFTDLISSGKNIFLSGIGGVSMRALAGLLMDMGAKVCGSDRDDSPVLSGLRKQGAAIYTPQRAENIA